MNAKTVSETRSIISEVMQPSDSNFLDKVFGGRILAMIDLCAYVTSAKFSGTFCVTASFDRVDFHEPIEVAELVTLEGHVTFVGRTSMEVTIEVYAMNVQKGLTRHTNTARVTMVAIGPGGKPMEVPRLITETREDRLRFLEGKLRRELRAIQKDDFAKVMEGYTDKSDEELESLISQPKLLAH